MGKRGRPALGATPELQRFASEYLANGQNAKRAAIAIWGERTGNQRRHRALLQARKYGLLPSLEGDALASKPAPNVAPLKGVDLVHISPPPALPAGKSYADLSTLSNSELLQRMSFIATASISPFARFDFVPDTPARYEIRKVFNKDTNEVEEREVLADPGRMAPEGAAEEHDGQRGMWTASLDAQSFATAVRAGYGVLVKEVSYDPQGRIKLKLHDAAAMQATLARIKGLDKSASQTVSIEQLTLVSQLSPEEQRRRALAAISRPLQGATMEDAVDAEVVADYAVKIRASDAQGGGVAGLPLATIPGEEIAKIADAPDEEEKAS